MNHHNQILKDTAFIGIGQLIGAAVTAGIFAFVGRLDKTVVAGSIAGAGLAIINYFLLYLIAEKAADQAEHQDVAGGQKLLRLSYMGRMIGLLVVLVLLGKRSHCNLIALVVPLILNRPILTVYAFLHRKDGAVP